MVSALLWNADSMVSAVSWVVLFLAIGFPRSVKLLLRCSIDNMASATGDVKKYVALHKNNERAGKSL
jgi:hypothetical protein